MQAEGSFSSPLCHTRMHNMWEALPFQNRAHQPPKAVQWPDQALKIPLSDKTDGANNKVCYSIPMFYVINFRSKWRLEKPLKTEVA